MMASEQASQYIEPTDDHLGQLALDAVKRSRSAYRRLQAAGELETEVRERVKACREQAGELIGIGTPPVLAWQTAIREAIIGVDSD